MARRARFTTLLFGLCLATVALSGTAEAQKKKPKKAAPAEEFSLDEPAPAAEAPPEEPAAEEPPPVEEDKEAVLLSDEQALEEERAPQEQFRESTDPYEDPEKGYFFVGAAWRYARMPSWVLEWGLDHAPSIGTAGSFFGEFAYRKDGFQVAADVGWVKWGFAGPFQLAGDPPTDTEWLNGKFNILSLSSTLTWSTSFAPWFSLDYGVEAGLAFIFGDLTRTEAYRKQGGGWAACPGPATPASPVEQQGMWCETPLPDKNGNIPATNGADEEGAQYGVKATHGLFNKGVPHALPILGPRLSLRFKPIHQLVLRVDVPLPVFPFGFTGGLAAQYGF